MRYVLEGSVRKSGARVRITAQLIDAATGGHLWAERFDRDLTDIFAVQDDVTTQIVSALALNLSAGDRQSIAAEHTDNQEAYDCFLRGRELWWRHARDANREAEALLRRADRTRPRLCARLRLPRRGEGERLCERVERLARAEAWRRPTRPRDSRCDSTNATPMRCGRSPASVFGRAATTRR